MITSIGKVIHVQQDAVSITFSSSSYIGALAYRSDTKKCTVFSSSSFNLTISSSYFWYVFPILDASNYIELSVRIHLSGSNAVVRNVYKKLNFYHVPATQQLPITGETEVFAMSDFLIRGVVFQNATPEIETLYTIDRSNTNISQTNNVITGNNVSLAFSSENAKIYVDSSTTLPETFDAGSTHTITAQGTPPPEITIDYTNTQEPIITQT